MLASEPDATESASPLGPISLILLIFGLLVVIPSGLCVGMSLYALYAHTGGTTVWIELALMVGAGVFAFGALSIFGAFRSRVDPDDE